MSIKAGDQRELSYLPYLDGWRGVAIIMVLLEHFTVFGATYHLGGLGVNIFFVLSGLLMSRILFVQKVPISTFYRRRFARILPAFWLYISVVFFCWYFFFSEFQGYEFFSTLFFLRTYFPETISIFKSYVPIGHIWSLNIEEHSYILLSLVSMLAGFWGKGFVKLALVFLSLLCVCFFIFYKFNPPISQSLFFLRTEVATFPLLLSCTLYLWLEKYPVKFPNYISPFFFILALGVSLISGSIFLSYIGISISLALSINTLSFAPAWMISILSNAILRWFGICSYSIYLWQQLFYFLGRYVTDFIYYPIFSLIMTLFIASCSFYFFERPLRRWLSGR